MTLAALTGCGASREPTGGPAPGAAPAPAAPPSLDQVLRADLAVHHAIPWSAARRLTWADFQADPPPAGEETARTAYGIYYAYRCRGRFFEFRVIAALHPRESWVKTAVLRDSAASRRTLAHEQTHFDITELHARRMRGAFRELVDPCARSDAALDAVAQRLIQEEKETQRRYDADTDHGLEPRQQARWEAEIGRELAAPP